MVVEEMSMAPVYCTRCGESMGSGGFHMCGETTQDQGPLKRTECVCGHWHQGRDCDWKEFCSCTKFQVSGNRFPAPKVIDGLNAGDIVTVQWRGHEFTGPLWVDDNGRNRVGCWFAEGDYFVRVEESATESKYFDGECGAEPSEDWEGSAPDVPLETLQEVFKEPPHVVPTSSGEYRIEWHRCGVDVEIAIDRSGDAGGWWGAAETFDTFKQTKDVWDEIRDHIPESFWAVWTWDEKDNISPSSRSLDVADRQRIALEIIERARKVLEAKPKGSDLK